MIIAVAATPLASLLLAGAPRCAHATIVAVSSRMLVVFAPQILLYGLAVVLYGILQAHRRFTAPALAPVLSSLVVISAYLAFVPLSQGYGRLASLPRPAELTLSVGTTAGVAALVLTALVPALRLRLRLRPTLRFPAGVAPRIRGLAAVGLIALIAQDASVVAVMVLANGQEGQGALVLYNFGWQMFFVPYAVLAVPIATTAFPLLAAATGARFDAASAASTRAVMLVTWLGAALLAGAAVPASRLFTHYPGDARQLAYTFAAFAPGLIGYGLSTHLSRVLFADARTRVAAAALVGGWLLVIIADVVAVALVPDWWVVPVLGLGNTIGLTVAGVALLGAVRRARGRAALRGTARAALAGLAGAVAGAAAGGALSAAVPARGFVPNAGVTILACGCVTLVFAGAALALDGGDLRAVLARGRGVLPGLPAGRAEAAAVTGAAGPAGAAGQAGPGTRPGWPSATWSARPPGGPGGTWPCWPGGAPPVAPRSTCTAPLPPPPPSPAPPSRARPRGRAGTSVRWTSPPSPVPPATPRPSCGSGGCWPATGPTCCTRTACGRVRWPRWPWPGPAPRAPRWW